MDAGLEHTMLDGGGSGSMHQTRGGGGGYAHVIFRNEQLPNNRLYAEAGTTAPRRMFRARRVASSFVGTETNSTWRRRL